MTSQPYDCPLISPTHPAVDMRVMRSFKAQSHRLEPLCDGVPLFSSSVCSLLNAPDIQQGQGPRFAYVSTVFYRLLWELHMPPPWGTLGSSLKAINDCTSFKSHITRLYHLRGRESTSEFPGKVPSLLWLHKYRWPYVNPCGEHISVWWARLAWSWVICPSPNQSRGPGILPSVLGIGAALV